MLGPVLVSLVGESELLLAVAPVSRLGMSGESPLTSICSSLLRLVATAASLLLVVVAAGAFHHSSPSAGRVTYL